MSSTRLPGKVLAPIVGRPMLARQVERVRRARRLDRVAVATSRRPDDDGLVVLCEQIGIDCYRGSLENVLERYYNAASGFGARSIVRLTADCPLSDPEVIDDLVAFFECGDYDYASNTLEPTWPHGLDVEIMSFDSLASAHNDARDPADLEHVTRYFYTHPDRFHLGSLKGQRDLSRYRWTVDYPEDLDVVTEIFEALYPGNAKFSTDEVVAFLREHPEVQARNSHIETRNNRLAPCVLAAGAA